jgi:hypothetical protein
MLLFAPLLTFGTHGCFHRSQRFFAPVRLRASLRCDFVERFGATI